MSSATGGGGGGGGGDTVEGVEGVLLVPPLSPPLLHALRNRPANSNSESIEDSDLLDDRAISSSFG